MRQGFYAEDIKRLIQKISEQEKDIAELKAWKESATSVMPDMQAIGRALNVPLGQSVHDKILPGIERLKGLIKSQFMSARPYRKTEYLELDWEKFKSENNL